MAWALFCHDFDLSKGINILSEKCPVVLDHYNLRFISLDQTEEQYRDFIFNKTVSDKNEAYRFQPSYAHHFLPLNFHPDYYKGDRNRYDTPYSIRGSRSLRTGLPVRVSCTIGGGKSSTGNQLEKALTATMTPLQEWGGSRCKGGDAVMKNNHLLGFSFEAYPDTVPELDKLHQAILTKVTSYIQN